MFLTKTDVGDTEESGKISEGKCKLRRKSEGNRGRAKVRIMNTVEEKHFGFLVKNHKLVLPQ